MTVADDFSGTMAATSGDFGASDTVEIYVADPEVKYYVEYSGDPVKYSSIYASSALEQKNKYEVFFGGNFDKLLISTTADTERTLLVFKDSYANCLLPMLTPYFSKITVIDPRYFSDNLSAVLDETTFTHVLFLYNLNTFLEDHSLASALKS